MLSRTEGRDLGSRLLHALPLQGGLPRPPAYIDVAMVDERRRERRAFTAKCVGKAVQRIAGAFSQRSGTLRFHGDEVKFFLCH